LAPKNRVRKVLRIWLHDGRFATYCCARCGTRGEAHTGRIDGRRVDRDAIGRARAEAETRDRTTAAERLKAAKALWCRRQLLQGTIAETYLREVRCFSGSVPTTIGFLTAHGEHPPAMVAAFGIPDEPEPGLLALPIAAVRGIHITRLLPDGSGKAEDPAKIIIGRCLGVPIVLAPLNDNLGLAIVEGSEDGLSVHEATGLGVWVAGAASRMPALAGMVPSYADAVSIIADADYAGRRHSTELAARLQARGMRPEIVALSDHVSAEP
jgi:hypothetical protein